MRCYEGDSVMSNYSIDLTKNSSFFIIKNEMFDTIPYYMQKTFSYGTDDGEYSNLVIYTDIRTCEILAIVCSSKMNAIEIGCLFDCHEFDIFDILKEKVKASFITPKGVVDTYDFIHDFTAYFSKDMLKIIFEDGEPHYLYTDDRMKLYYDDDYNLLEIIINDLTEEEFEALRSKKWPPSN
jgi:hypothetical protein